MSVKLMGQVWELDLDHGKQSVLLALADHAHDDGTRCFPGVDYLAWKTGYSGRQVQRTLRELESDGLIKPVANEKGGRGNATEYHIHVEKGVKKSPFVAKDRGPSESVKGDICDAKGDICDIKGDIATSPQPSVTTNEPSSSAACREEEAGQASPQQPVEWWDAALSWLAEHDVPIRRAEMYLAAQVRDFGVDRVGAAVAEARTRRGVFKATGYLSTLLNEGPRGSPPDSKPLPQPSGETTEQKQARLQQKWKKSA